MLTVAFSTALVGTRHPLYQQLCWRPVSVVPQVAAGQAQLIWVPEAGQGQLIWVPEAGQAHPPWVPVEADQGQLIWVPEAGQAHPPWKPVEAGQAQPFWMPAAPEAVVRPAFLPPHPRTKVQPERFSWPVKAVRVHPSSALEDPAAVVQGRLFSEPEGAARPQVLLPVEEPQAQLFWVPEAPEAVDQTAFLPPQPRAQEQPERSALPVVPVHPSLALEDRAAVVQGRLFSEPEEAGQPQAFLPQGEAQEPAWLHPLPPCPPPSLPPLRVALRF